VDHRVRTRRHDRLDQRVPIERVGHGGPGAGLLQRAAALLRAREAGDLVSGVEELPNERLPDRPRGARDEDPHCLVLQSSAPSTTAPTLM
jgi:hypothetical protein